MEILKRITQLNTNEIISTFLLNNWFAIAPFLLALLYVTYVKFSKSTNDDKFLKILTDHIKIIFNFIRMRGFKK